MVHENLHQGPHIRGTAMAMALLAVFGFGGFVIWSSSAPLASAVIASGSIRVDTNRKPVQHLEGGVVAEVLVREGQAVKAGDILLRMDGTWGGADLAVVENNLSSALAEQARLRAALSGAPLIEYPGMLLSKAHEPELARLMAEQQTLLATERASLDADIAVAQTRSRQSQAAITSAEQQLVSNARQRSLIAEEAAGVKTLIDRGLERKPRLLGLNRAQAGLEAERAALHGRISSGREAVAQAEAEIEALRARYHSRAATELGRVTALIGDLDEKRAKAADRTRRLDLTSPQDGTVLDLRMFAAGAVVAPGGIVMDIVPANEPLTLEARVAPQDIHLVYPGLPAQVRLTAFKRRIAPTVTGTVERVSADSLTDPRTGDTHFLARVTIDPANLASLSGITLYPGMPGEAIILTGEQTVLDYLLRPLSDSFANAFREG